jgi:hypothetical protein
MDTLKPLAPESKLCAYCKTVFLSFLELKGEQFKTCDDCRRKNKIQDRKHRKNKK